MKWFCEARWSCPSVDHCMEFHQLGYFVAAAETGSMSRAAERERVSQPALSRQVAKLEGQLGVALFARKKQRIHLTDAGRFFLPKARRILCDAVTAEQQLREQFGNQKRALRLGFVGPFLDDLVAPTVRELKRTHRSLRISLFDLHPRAQLERLAANELDAALLGNLHSDHREQFRARRLSRHRFAAVLPEDHVLAEPSGRSKDGAMAGRARSIGLAALRSEEWVSLDDAFFPGRRELLRSACAEAGFEPNIVAEFDSLSMMLGAVASGGVVAFAPLHSQMIPHAGCSFVRLKAPVPTIDLQLVTRRRERMEDLETLYDRLRSRALMLADA